MIRKLGLFGLGEVGAILAEDLGRSSDEIAAWDVQFSDPDSTPSRNASATAVRICEDAAGAARGAQLIISAVTAAQTENVAREAAAAIGPGSFFLDLNSASPSAKRRAADTINGAGGRYIEAAVMSPFAPKRCASPVLLGGPHAGAFLPLARELGFLGARVFSPTYGQASAAKLCRSVMVKGIEALLTESLLSARHYGVEETVLASLDDLFPGQGWKDLSRYMISRTLEHGGRRAEEMREAANTVEEAGVQPWLSTAIAARQDWASQFKPALEAATLPELLDAIRQLMDARAT